MTQPVERQSKKQRNKLAKHLNKSNKETTEIKPFTPADLTLNNTYDDEDYEDLRGKFTRTAREPINSATKNFTRLQNQLWDTLIRNEYQKSIISYQRHNFFFKKTNTTKYRYKNMNL